MHSGRPNGLRCGVVVEHHFLTTFSMSPCPEVILSAIAAQTKHIRLGFGVVILPYHHPVRVAERIAMLDHISKGRVEFGTGRSAPYEQTGMGIDPRLTRDMWEESLTMIPKIWESDMFTWEGRFWNVPPREVCQALPEAPSSHLGRRVTAATYAIAAQKGIGVMSLGVNAPSVLEPHIKAYVTPSKKPTQWAASSTQVAHFLFRILRRG